MKDKHDHFLYSDGTLCVSCVRSICVCFLWLNQSFFGFPSYWDVVYLIRGRRAVMNFLYSIISITGVLVLEFESNRKQTRRQNPYYM